MPQSNKIFYDENPRSRQAEKVEIAFAHGLRHLNQQSSNNGSSRFFKKNIPEGPLLDRIVIFGQETNNREYSRNASLAAAVKAFDPAFQRCTSNRGVPEPWLGPIAKIRRAIVNLPLRWLNLYQRYRKLNPHGVLLVPYPAHLDGFLACVLAKRFKRKIVVDALFGLYDTVVRDRALVKKGSLPALLIRLHEKWLLKSVDRVLVDTPQHARMLQSDYGLPANRFSAIPVGIDETLWQPGPLRPGGVFKVVFWSTFIPLHGVSVVAKAAKRLETEIDPAVSFLVIGNGQCAEEFRKLYETLSPANLSWIDRFIPLDAIYAFVRDAHCGLGVFGAGGKAGRVIPYKAYQTLSSAKVLVTARTPAASRVFKNGVNALLVDPMDPESLASAIRLLAKNPSLAQKIATNGNHLFNTELSQKMVEIAFRKAMNNTLEGGK